MSRARPLPQQESKSVPNGIVDSQAAINRLRRGRSVGDRPYETLLRANEALEKEPRMTSARRAVFCHDRSASVEAQVKPDWSGPAGRLNGMNDDVNHCVAAAGRRHTSIGAVRTGASAARRVHRRVGVSEGPKMAGPRSECGSRFLLGKSWEAIRRERRHGVRMPQV